MDESKAKSFLRLDFRLKPAWYLGVQFAHWLLLPSVANVNFIILILSSKNLPMTSLEF